MKTTKRTKNSLFKILPLCVVLALAGCASSPSAESLYKKQDYIGAIRVIATDMNQKKSPSKSTQKRWSELTANSLANIEAMPQATNEDKVIRLEHIYEARTLLDRQNLGEEITAFNQRYPMESLKLEIAKTYYAIGQATTGNYREAYRVRAYAYGRGAQFNHYKNIQQLATKNQLLYDTDVAEEHYREGKHLENSEPKAAAIAYQKALDAYKAHGTYKDASKRLRVTDEIWRKKEADGYISTAQRYAQYNSKKSYRQASEAYQKAYDLYSMYGNYKGSQELAQQYKKLGNIKYNYNITFDYNNNGCGNYYNSLTERNVKSALSGSFRDDFLIPSFSHENPDWFLNINHNIAYKESSPSNHSQIESFIDSEGKEWRYNKITTQKTQELIFYVTVNSSGLMNNNQTATSSITNQHNTITYTGNVPPNLKNTTSGQWQSTDTMCNNIQRENERKIRNIVDNYVYRVRDL